MVERRLGRVTVTLQSTIPRATIVTQSSQLRTENTVDTYRAEKLPVRSTCILCRTHFISADLH